MFSVKFSVNIPPRWGIVGCFVVAVLWTVASAHSDNFVDTTVIPIVEGSEPSQQCAGYCKQGNKFRLKPGSSYVYDYQALTVSTVTGTSNDTSSLSLTAKAEVHVTSPCELILQLSNVKLEDTGPTDKYVAASRQEEFRIALQKHSLRFSFQDGVIDQLCPSEDEAVWALNIKRGILSGLQNSMRFIDAAYTHTYEVDVNGVCETIYRSQPGRFGKYLVQKHKNLLQCTGRGKQSLVFPGIFSANDQTKSTPLIRSEQTCHQDINTAGYVRKSTCLEVHLFTPFSNRDSGISTRIIQTLELDSIVEFSAAPKIEKFVNFRTNLKFDYSSANVHDSTEDELVEKTLETLSMNTQNGITKDIPQMFASLIDQLKGFSYDQLQKVFSKKKDKHSLKFLLDAMPLVGTIDSVLIMQDLFTSGDLSQDEIDAWLTSLLFYKKPTLQLLDAVKYFLADENNSKSILTISSMVHSYCTLDRQCTNKHEVIEVMNIIQNRLKDSCRTETKEEKDRMIITLKALGNAGIYTRPLDTLSACYKNALNSMEVRLAAVSAFRRFSCELISKSSIIDLFYDQKQDVELRIAGYLAAMQCPTVDIVQKVVDMLYSDETFHVKSFVWTHLTNLKETSSQWRRDIFYILQEYKLPENITADARFYSRNYENSVFNENLDVGATLDSNIIFSTQSYLPRSATLNLTLDLFGEAINVFEVGTRLEGFENLIEDLFSKTGIFPEESLRAMLKNLRNESSNNEITSDIKDHSDKFKAQRSFLGKPPRGSMFARVFGHELYLKQFYGLNELLEGNKLIDNQFYFNTKNLFNGKDIDYTNSVVFLDSNYIIPTAVGLPLTININGTTTVGLKLKAEADLNELLKTKSGNIVFQLNPSAAVQIVGTMTVDAKVTSSGIKSISKLNTNTYMDTKIIIDKGTVDTYINLPREQMEIFDVSSNLFLIHHDRLDEIKGIEENAEDWDTCSEDRITTISGLRLCSQLMLRNASQQQSAPSFPLTGSFKYALLLQKSDTFDAYHIQLVKDIKSSTSRFEGEISVLFDTPGSTMNRALKAKLKMGLNDASLLLDSPVGSIELNGKYQKSELELQAVVNKKSVFNLLFNLQNYDNGRYASSLWLYANGYVNVNSSGVINIIPGSKYNTELQISGLTRDPLILSGYLSGKEGRYNLGFVTKAPSVNVKLQGDLRYTKTSFSTKAMVAYALNNQPSQHLDFATKLHAHKKGELWKYALVTSLQSSKYSAYNTRFSWMFYQSENYYDCVTDLKVGKTEWNAQQLYHNYRLANGGTDFAIKLTLSSPPKDLDYRLEHQFINTQARTFVFGLAQLNEKQRFITSFDVHTKAANDKKLSIELANPWRGVYFNGQLEPKHEDTLYLNVTTGLIENQKKTRELHYWSLIQYYGSNRQNFHINGELHNFNVWNDPFLIEGGLQYIQEEGAFKTNLQIYKPGFDSLNMYLMYSESLLDINIHVLYGGQNYGGNLHFANTEQVLKFSTSLDLERKLSFSIESSQNDQTYLSELKLYWNEKIDNSQSLIMSFKNMNGIQQNAYIMMPGHYAAFDIKHLNEGLSSVNLTAIWGESKDSATNAIMLSTAWLLSETELTSIAILTTPFIGLEHQAVDLKLVLSEDPSAFKNMLKTGLQWQDQKVDVQLSWQHTETLVNGFLYINGTIDILKNITLNIDHQVNSLPLDVLYFSNSKLEASYNSLESTKLHIIILSKENQKQMDLHFTSPFHNYENILLNITKKDTEFKLVKSWAKDKTITLDYFYELPYIARIKFTSPFDRYNLASFDYVIDSSTPNNFISIKGVLNKNYATCKLKGFQTREVGQRGQMLSQIISGEIETEGNYFIPSFVANFTHKVDRNNISTHFVTINDKYVVLDLNLTYEYENTKLLKGITLDIVTQSHKINGKFTKNKIEKRNKYNFEGFWNEDNITMSLFSNCNLPNIFITFDASSSFWRDNLKIEFVNEYAGQHSRLEIKLPPSRLANDNSSLPSFVIFDYSKFGMNVINAEVILISPPLIDKFEATYKYSMLTETSHTQHFDIEYNKNKYIIADFIAAMEKEEKYISLSIMTPLYKDIGLSANYTTKENENINRLRLKAELDDKIYAVTAETFLIDMSAKVLLSIETSDGGEIIDTRLIYDIRNQEWLSEVFISYFGSITNFKIFVDWVKEGKISTELPVEDWEKVMSILSEPKKVQFIFSQNQNNIEMEFINERSIGNFNGSMALNTKFNNVTHQYLSVLHCVCLPSDYSLSFIHKHNDGKVFNFNTKTKYDSTSFSVLTDANMPFKNWENLKFKIHFGHTNNTQQLKGLFEKNELKYELKGKMNISSNLLATEMEFKAPDTDLTFYSKYIGSENHTLYVYAVYNKDIIQGLSTLNIYEDDEKLKQGWQLESDFSWNGKHYKFNSGSDLQVIDNLDDVLALLKENIDLHNILKTIPCEYQKNIYFELQYDDVSHFMNYHLHTNDFEINDNNLNISLPYFSEFNFNLNFTNTNLTILSKTTNPNFMFVGKIEYKKPSVIVISPIVNITGKIDGKDLHLSAFTTIHMCNLTVKNNDNISIDFNSNIENWENLNVIVNYTYKNFIISVLRNEVDSKLSLNICKGFFCADGNFTFTRPGFLFTTEASYDFRRYYYESQIAYNINGESKKFSTKFIFETNQTKINFITPIEGYEDLKLTGTYDDMNTIFVLEQNSRKALSASMKKQNDDTVLRITSFIGTSEYINISLNHQGGVLNTMYKDMIISITIFKKEMKILDSSFAIFLDASKKIGIQSHLYSKVLNPTFNNIKFVACLENGKSKIATLYGLVNQPLIDIVGYMEGTINNGKLLLSTPLGFTKYQLTSIEINYNLISHKNSLFLQVESKNHLPYTISANVSRNDVLSEMNIELNTENPIDINNCRFYALYNNSDSISINTVIDFNLNNYLDISIITDTPLNAHFSAKLKQPKVPLLQFDINYNMLVLKKNIELYVTYNTAVYEFNGSLELLNNFLNAKIYFNTNGIQHVFTNYSGSSYNIKSEVQYDFNESGKFVMLYYNTNNDTEYNLNMTSLNSKHLEFVVKLEKNSSIPILDYFNLKYNLFDEAVFNVKTKYQKHNVLINCALDSVNGTMSFSHLNDNLLDNLEVAYDYTHGLNISLIGISKSTKSFEILIVKNHTDRDIKLNIYKLWMPNLFKFHIQNSLRPVQNLKWNLSLVNGNYSSSGDISNTGDFYDKYGSKQFQFNSNLTLQNINYNLECSFSKDSKFAAKVIENFTNQLFSIEGQIDCSKHSKRFCEERDNYMKILGLTEDPILINYYQKLTEHKKSLVLLYSVEGSQSSISVEMPIKITDHIKIEWKNTFLSEIYLQFDLFNHPSNGIQTICTLYLNEMKQFEFEKKLNYTSVTILFQYEPWKFELNNTTLMLLMGKEHIYVKYSPLHINNYSFTFNSTFNVLNYFNLNYMENNNNAIFVDFYTISDKHYIEWKAESYYEATNNNFNVSFTDIKRAFTINFKKIVEIESLVSHFQIEQNGIVKGNGTLKYFQNGFKCDTEFMINYNNYSLQLDLKSSPNSGFNNLSALLLTPSAEYVSLTELSCIKMDCLLHQVNYIRYEKPIKEFKSAEITWKLNQYSKHHETQFKTKVGLKTFSTIYEMYKTTIFIKSSWFNLEETGLIIGKDLDQNSVLIKLFSELREINLVHDLIYEEGSIFYSVQLKIPDTDIIGWKGLSGVTNLIGFYDKTTNELKFEFESPLINYEHVMFYISQNNKDIFTTYDLLLQQKHADVIKLTVNTSTVHNINVSGHFFKHTTINFVIHKEDNNIISAVELVLFSEKIINMSLNLDQQVNNWDVLLVVDKFVKLSNLTTQIQRKVDMFGLNIKHELIDVHWKINSNEEGIKSLLLIDSSIVNKFNLETLSLINVNKTTNCQTNITLSFANKFYIVNSSVSATANNVDVFVDYSSFKGLKIQRNSFKLGGVLTKEDRIQTVYVYVNNNNFTGRLCNTNSLLDIIIEYSIPDVNINGTFNFNSKISPIFEVIISYDFLGKTRLLSIKLDKQSNSLQSNAEIKIDNVSHLVEFNVFWRRTPILIELNYIDDKLQMYKSSLKITNDEEYQLLRLIGSVQSPKWNQIDLETIYDGKNKILKVTSNEFEFHSQLDKNNCNLFFKTGLVEYKIEYVIKNLEYLVNISSPFASAVVYCELGDGMLAISSHSNYRGVIFEARGTIIYNEDYKKFLIEFKNGENVVVFTESLLNIQNDLIELTGICNVAQSINELRFTHNLSFPRDTHLSLSSPLLSNGIIEAGITSKDASMLFLLRLGQTHLKLGASFDPEDGVKINIQAPIFSKMDTATINGFFLKEVEGYTDELNRCKISASVAFTSDNVLLSQASIKFEFQVSSHVEVLVVMKTKTKQIDDVELFIHIPLRLNTNMITHVSLTLSKVQPVLLYFISNEHKCNSTLKIFGETFVASTIENTMDSFTWDLNILKHYVFLSLIKLKVDKILSVSYNNKNLFNLTSGFYNDNNWTKFAWELETQIKGHEKYGIKYEKKISEHKKMMILLSIPKIGTDLGFDLEYLFDNITHNLITAKFHLPFIVFDKHSYGFSFSNNINPDMKTFEVDYYVHIGKFLGSFSSFVHAGNNNLQLRGKGQLNNEIMFINLSTDIDSSKVQLYIDVGTPFNIVKDSKLQVTMNRIVVGSKVQLSYNSRTIAEFKINEKENKLKYFELKSIWKSASFGYLYDVGTSLNTLCLNLNNIDASQLCIEFTLKSENKLNHYLNSKFTLGSNVVEIECGCTHLVGDIEYFSYLSWGNNRTIGFKFLREDSGDNVDEYLKYNLLQIVLPERTIEGSTMVLKTIELEKGNIEFKWDLDNNPGKKIGVGYLFDNDNLVNTLTVQHFALQHDFVITSLLNDNELKLIVQYSPNETELFIIGITYWTFCNMDKGIIGAKFSIEHKASNMFIQLLTNSTITPVEIEGHFAISYINSTHNTIKYIDFVGGYNFEKKLLSLDLDSNGNNFVASGSFWKKENNFNGITVETRLNQKEPIKVEVGVNTKQLQLEVELNHGLSQTYVLYCGMPSNKEITGKMSHTLNGYKNTDALVTLKLNTTKLLWGRFEFNKPMFADLHNTLLLEYSDVELIFSELLKGVVEFYQEELTVSMNTLGKSLFEKVNLVLSSTYTEFDQVFNYFIHFGERLNKMYGQNQFYMQDIHHAWTSALSYSNDKINIGISIIVHVLDSAIQALNQILKHTNIQLSSIIDLFPDFKTLGQNVTQQTSNFLSHFKTMKKNITGNIKYLIKQSYETFEVMHREVFVILTSTEMEINNLVTQIHYLIQTHIYNVVVEWIDIADTAARTLLHITSDMADIVLEGIMSIKEIRQLVSLYGEFEHWLDDTLDVDYLFYVVRGFLNDTLELVRVDINKNFKEYQIYVEEVLDTLIAKYNEFLEQPVVHYIIVRVNQFYQKAIWLWNYSGISDENNTFWRSVLDIKSDDLATGLLVVDPGEKEFYSPKYVFDHSKHTVEFYQRLPFEWRGFNELPNMTDIATGIDVYIQDYEDESSPNESTFIKMLEDLIDEMSNEANDDNDDYDEVFGKTRDISAMIAGNNFFTFDGKSYVFAGGCSYILAGDLMTDSFSVIINYEIKDGKAKKKSLTIVASNSSVELNWNYKVTVDGNEQDLPIEIGSSTIIHRRVHEIVMHSLHGYTIECNFEVDICIFTLSSYNFGKTGGLLGTYNNHNFDDLTSPDGENLAIDEFVNSWVVGDSEEFDQCSIMEYLSPEYKEMNEEMLAYSEDCENLFISTKSQFSKCFDTVDPKIFYQMCRSNLALEDNDYNRAIFLTVSAYINKCKHDGIALTWPTKYSNCKWLNHGTPITSEIGVTMIDTDISNSADIVFVIEQANCTVTSNLGNLVTKLESALNTKQIINNRFAVVSFNGQMVNTPHVKTIDGEIWTQKAKDINKVLSSKSKWSNNPISTYEALNFASSLPFRLGVSKTIILVSCGNCEDKEHYNELISMFLKKDIKLHIVQHNAIIGINGKAKTVFGADINGAYTRRNVKSLSPSLPLLKKVSLPKDLCVPIALETNGTVFNLDLNKKILDVWSRIVAKSLEPKKCQIYHCVQQQNGPGLFISESCASVGISETDVIQEMNKQALEEYQNLDSADYLDYSMPKNKR